MFSPNTTIPIPARLGRTLYVGQDAYHTAQQFGTFGLNINVTGPLDPLSLQSAPVFDVIPGSEDVLAFRTPSILPSSVPPVAQTSPFPWGVVLIIAAIFFLSRR